MSVRASETWSTPLPLNGGVLRVPILGVLLFNLPTDDLEDPDGADDCRFIQESDLKNTEDAFGLSGMSVSTDDGRRSGIPSDHADDSFSPASTTSSDTLSEDSYKLSLIHI